MRNNVILAYLLSFITCNLRQLKEIPDYDCFVFAVQWSNNLCTGAEICDQKQKTIPKNSLSIHGFWPNFKNATLLTDCSPKTIPIDVKELTNFNELSKYWVNLMEESDTSFWEYEYSKHGYCYVVKNKLPSYAGYFEKVIDLFFFYELPTLFERAFPGQTGELRFQTVAEFRDKLKLVLPNQYFKISCNKVVTGDLSQRIIELQIAYGLNFAPSDYKLSADNCDKKLPVTLLFK